MHGSHNTILLYRSQAINKPPLAWLRGFLVIQYYSNCIIVKRVLVCLHTTAHLSRHITLATVQMSEMTEPMVLAISNTLLINKCSMGHQVCDSSCLGSIRFYIHVSNLTIICG